jgi:hypothetical protein
MGVEVVVVAAGASTATEAATLDMHGCDSATEEEPVLPDTANTSSKKRWGLW